MFFCNCPPNITTASSGTVLGDASESISLHFLPPISSCSYSDLHSFWDTICFQHELTCETEKGNVGLAQMQKPKAVPPPRTAALGSQLQLQLIELTVTVRIKTGTTVN